MRQRFMLATKIPSCHGSVAAVWATSESESGRADQLRGKQLESLSSSSHSGSAVVTARDSEQRTRNDSLENRYTDLVSPDDADCMSDTRAGTGPYKYLDHLSDLMDNLHFINHQLESTGGGPGREMPVTQSGKSSESTGEPGEGSWLSDSESKRILLVEFRRSSS
jgi:hypothetical protein